MHKHEEVVCTARVDLLLSAYYLYLQMPQFSRNERRPPSPATFTSGIQSTALSNT